MEIINLSTLNALVAVRGNICHAGLQQADVDVKPHIRKSWGHGCQGTTVRRG
jgi:hypothetical protein